MIENIRIKIGDDKKEIFLSVGDTMTQICRNNQFLGKEQRLIAINYLVGAGVIEVEPVHGTRGVRVSAIHAPDDLYEIQRGLGNLLPQVQKPTLFTKLATIEARIEYLENRIKEIGKCG